MKPAKEKALKQVETLADLLDSKYKVPGTDITFGLDALLGLLPVGGDAVSFTASAALILTMARHGASGSLILRMLWNVLVDAVVGSVPVLGDLFDIAYKANRRNVKLLKQHYKDDKYQSNGMGMLLLVGLALLAIAALIGYLLYTFWSLIFSLFQTSAG